MKRLASYRKDTSGVVAVEGALILPFLAALAFGAIDSSLLLLHNHKMETGLTAAGNYLARTPTPAIF